MIYWMVGKSLALFVWEIICQNLKNLMGGAK